MFEFVDISWRACCCGLYAFGVWSFVISNFTQVGNYLCLWLLVMQLAYYLMMLTSAIISCPKLTKVAVLSFPINFAMSVVVTFVTLTAREGTQEIKNFDNFSLHIAPTVLSFVELALSKQRTRRRNFCLRETGRRVLLLQSWVIFAPTIVLLLYYKCFFSKEIYQTQFDIHLPSAIVVSVLSSVLCALYCF